jgi:hypothetical protein
VAKKEKRKSKVSERESLGKIVAVCEHNRKANNSEGISRVETMNCYIKLIWANNF